MQNKYEKYRKLLASIFSYEISICYAMGLVYDGIITNKIVTI